MVKISNPIGSGLDVMMVVAEIVIVMNIIVDDKSIYRCG